MWPTLCFFIIVSLYNLKALKHAKLKHKTLPITFYIHKDAPDEAKEISVVAAKIWNKSLGKEAIKIAFDDYQSPMWLLSHNFRNDIVFTNDRDTQGSIDQLAFTTMVPSPFKIGYFNETDIVVVDYLRSYSLTEQCYKPGEVEKFPLLPVLMHEMGHGLGLGHYLGFSIMTPTLSTAFPLPTPLDVKHVKDKYPEYFK